MRILIILSAALALSACKQNVELPSLISPYRIDIQQGNVVTQEMVSKLKAGMTRSQVRFVLGSPLVTDMFHSDRWDYVYLMQKQGKADERRRLTVMFDGDKLVTLEGDIVLTDRALEPPPAPKSPSTVIISTEPKPAPAKPAVATPAPKPEAAKPALKPPVATTPPAKPEATVGAPPAAPKSEASAAPAAAKDDAQPAITTPAAKPAAREAEATKADGDADKSDPAKADASKSDPAKSDAAKADAVKADAPKPDATKADPAKTDAAVPDDKNDPSKRGIFGRMLDKIGF